MDGWETKYDLDWEEEKEKNEGEPEEGVSVKCIHCKIKGFQKKLQTYLRKKWYKEELWAKIFWMRKKIIYIID